MTYEAVFLNVFLRSFKRLPLNESARVRKRVKDICDDPYVGLPLKGNLAGFWKDNKFFATAGMIPIELEEDKKFLNAVA